MKLGDGYKWLKALLDNIATTTVQGVLHVPRWIAGFIKPIVNFLLDAWAKPIYDYLERMVVIAPTKKEVEQKVEDLKNAKTKEEIDHAIDNLP